MERLTAQDQTQLWLFRTMLDQVVTVGDMFPPDDSDLSYVATKVPLPKITGGAVCELAGVSVHA